jgi:hypothetical protein
MGTSTRRRTVRSATLVAVVAALLVAISSSGTFGQEVGARIRVQMTGGPFEGEHATSIERACDADFAGPGSWAVGGYSGTIPLLSFDVYVAADGAGFEDSLRLTLLDEETDDEVRFLSTGISFEVDDRGSSATLSGTGEIQEELSSGPAIPVEVTVECLSVLPSGRSGDSSTATPAPPTPQIQGSPPAGSSVVDLTLDFGAWAGNYRPWTLEEACFISEGSWMVTLQDAFAVPRSVSFVGAEADGEDPSIGVLSARFGQLPEATIYQTSEDATLELDPSGRARIVDQQATARLSNGTTIEGPLEATIECAAVSP